MKGLLIAVLFGITVLTFVGCGKDPRQVQINGEKPGHLPKRHQGHEGVDCGRGRSSHGSTDVGWSKERIRR